MEEYVLIVEFVLATHCILTQEQVKPKLPDSPQLLNRDTTFSIGMPTFDILTIVRPPLGRHVPTLRSNSIFLAVGSIVWPNYLMLSFLEGKLLLCWEVKNTNMTIGWDHARPFTTSVPYSRPDMT